MPRTEWPSQHSSRLRRADGRQNRKRLLDAAAELLRTGEAFTLTDVAAAAGISTATAYRHFRSAEDAVEAFVGGFWDDADARVAAAGPPIDLRRLCEIWVAAVLDWGPALAYLRSREGFLARRAAGDERVARSVRIAEPPVAAALARAGSRPAADDLSHAIAIWNALADPREILDQRDSLHWEPGAIAERLHAAVRGAITGAHRGR